MFVDLVFFLSRCFRIFYIEAHVCLMHQLQLLMNHIWQQKKTQTNYHVTLERALNLSRQWQNTRYNFFKWCLLFFADQMKTTDSFVRVSVTIWWSFIVTIIYLVSTEMHNNMLDITFCLSITQTCIVVYYLRVLRTNQIQLSSCTIIVHHVNFNSCCTLMFF